MPLRIETSPATKRLVKKWVERLSLQHWNLVVVETETKRYWKHRESSFETDMGYCAADAASMSALIVLKPREWLNRRNEERAAGLGGVDVLNVTTEQVLVHELCHLVLWPMASQLSESSAPVALPMEEEAVERLVRALTYKIPLRKERKKHAKRTA